MSNTHSSPSHAGLARRAAVIGATVAASLVGWAVSAAAQPTAAFPAQVTPTPVAFDLYAVSGTTNLPGLPSIPVWGYSSDGTGVTKPGGPTLVVHQGDAVTITLHNHSARRTRSSCAARACGPTGSASVAGPTGGHAGPIRSPPTKSGRSSTRPARSPTRPIRWRWVSTARSSCCRARGLPMDPTLMRRC